MRLKNKEWTVPLFAVLLGIIGLVFIYSASSYSALLSYGDSFFYVKKQVVAFIVGLGAMFFGMYIPRKLLIRFKWVILAVSVTLLGLVFIPGLGVESYGATRWLSLGFTTFQPSEIAKFGFIIFLAGYFYEKPPICFRNLIIPILSCLVMCVAIILEPNMSITLVVGLSFLFLVFIAGVHKKYFIFFFVAILIAGVALLIAEPYRLSRFSAFINPWENPKGEGYQLIQSFYAISSGGLFGVGLFQSRQKYLFLPFAESDFIFSIIAEETGLVGCVVVMALFFCLIFFSYRIAMRAEDRYVFLLVSGLTSVIFLQTIINLAVVSGCIPPTGVPLPFVSFGGSSLVSFLFVVGLISNTKAVPKKNAAT